MPWMRKLATIATAAEAARRYAKKNPDQAGKYLDQAAAFVDKQTKGRYTTQIAGVADKVKGVAGVPRGTRPAAGNPSANGYPQGAAGYSAPQPSAGTTSPTSTPPGPPPVYEQPTTPVSKPSPTPPSPPSGRPTEG